MPVRLNLTLRIMALILLGLITTSAIIVARSELVLEEAILEQSKQQARTFLSGLEQQIILLGSPLDSEVTGRVLRQSLALARVLDFSIHRLYAYDTQGEIIAYTGDVMPTKRDLSGHYGEVVRDGRTYLGQDVEFFHDDQTGRETAKTDVIIPIHYQGSVVAGLEVEINLKETLLMINQLDNKYEQEIILIVTLSIILGMLLIWWVIHQGLVSPIRVLGQLTHSIAEGDLSARTIATKNNEIGHLGRDINRMADSIETLFSEQETAYLQMLQSLAKALETKDSYTAVHSARVSKYAVLLGRRLGLSSDELKLLKQGSLMHDLGKIGISDTILNKPGSLSESEYEIMRSHPEMTATIMRPLKRFKEFSEIAAWHHERWDGNGYPDGLMGEQIPLLARIVCLADTWDAMTGDRVYRKGFEIGEALSLLERERDSGQWEPRLVDVFVEMIRSSQNAHDEVVGDMFTPATQSESADLE